MRRLAPAARSLVLALLLSGCGLVDLAIGQLELVNGQRELGRALARERDPERAALLREVPLLLAFAEDVMGMDAGQSYRGYYATERPGMTYVLSASARLKFEAYTWWFPIAGKVEYRSYFDERDARTAAAELEARGYDTWISPSRAYSTLGFFRDPISTTMMRKGLGPFVEVLLHELAHAKHYVPGHTDWNETLATFVGERGAEQYFSRPRFTSTGLLSQWRDQMRRRRAMEALVLRACTRLEALYASGADATRMLRERKRVFAESSAELARMHPEEDPALFRVNNARLLQFRRYAANSERVSALWTQSGEDFRRFFRLAQAYAQHELD